MHAAIKCRGVTVLEIGAAATVDQERVTGKHPVVDPVGVMPVGVSRRKQRFHPDTANFHRLTFLQAHVRAGEIVERRVRDFAAGFALEPARGGDVVGVNVAVERVGELQA